MAKTKTKTDETIAHVLKEPEDFVAIRKLNKDLKKASTLLSRTEARYLVDTYYQWQDLRKSANNVIRSQGGEPTGVMKYQAQCFLTLEKNMNLALKHFAKRWKVGNWLMGITGIGHTITAGLIAHVDITRANSASSLIKFAGLTDPKFQEWKKGVKRPFNAKLKKLCFLIGTCAIQQTGRGSYYGGLIVERLEKEWVKNLNGKNVEAAKAALEAKNIGKDTDAYRWYSGCVTPEDAVAFRAARKEETENVKKEKAKGNNPTTKTIKPNYREPGSGLRMLPPDHVLSRARRWGVKIFLGHLYDAMYRDYYDKTPRVPYVFSEYCEERHNTFIPPPVEFGAQPGDSLRQLASGPAG